ncbi:DUF368 domain-containing protein [Paucilactobacillus suebicus]|uniref:Integral membrane protein n=1 Tax=Paucilactobacillus suebicus DSM 5007 = KCTC 3549 TaxID=1423807 RepID=A0A0R1VWZ8_9LACO|nr:DUF368 domain-containing protein [Paucilactobacillus suebicus]KRM10222.1 hypothetical protein FD16_GL001426 [Paucilactobacillus suebicus DSM 5007 = KCTC 3549]
MNNYRSQNWLLRFLKGSLIGTGFILPGISGGALAAVFGLYERLIDFLAHPFKKLTSNIIFFLPVGVGAIGGIFLLSFAISYLLGNFETIILWFFIGAIVGTVPALWQDAGKQGRRPRDVIIMSASFVAMALFLMFGAPLFSEIEPTFGAWIMGGALIGLGLVIPGLSPSNFLIYLGLYKPMSDAIKIGDVTVLLPLVIGVVLIIAVMAKLMDHLFRVIYSQLFHFILGIVLASTIMIIPSDVVNLSVGGILISIVMLTIGTWLGWWMSRLDQTAR